MLPSKYIFGLLALATITIWLAVLAAPDDRLRLIACDVGQGDAMLVVYGQSQILIDGGPDDSVLDCLASHMPFWDRRIELVILTHPQTDHFRGLIEVFRRYKIDVFLTLPLNSSTSAYQVLRNEVGGSKTEVLDATAGKVVRLGLMQLDIVHPTKDFLAGANTSSGDPNDFSIVAILSFGEFEALLTGDIGPDVMDEVIEQLALSGVEQVEYIKIPHHGSKNGLTKELLEASMPEVAVISVGKNPWGHPHKEVLEMLQERGVKIKRTDLDGDIKVVTDGKVWWLKD